MVKNSGQCVTIALVCEINSKVNMEWYFGIYLDMRHLAVTSRAGVHWPNNSLFNEWNNYYGP